MLICPPRWFSDRTRRTALTLLEVTIATALLGLLMTASVQVLRAVQTQQRAADRRTAALQTVQAIAEQVSNFSWEKVATEQLEKLQLPEAIVQYLPAAKLATTMNEEHEPVAAKRVSFALSWRGPKGQPAGPIRLTIWVYKD